MQAAGAQWPMVGINAISQVRNAGTVWQANRQNAVTPGGAINGYGIIRG